MELNFTCESPDFSVGGAAAHGQQSQQKSDYPAFHPSSLSELLRMVPSPSKPDDVGNRGDPCLIAPPSCANYSAKCKWDSPDPQAGLRPRGLNPRSRIRRRKIPGAMTILGPTSAVSVTNTGRRWLQGIFLKVSIRLSCN